MPTQIIAFGIFSQVDVLLCLELLHLWSPGIELILWEHNRLFSYIDEHPSHIHKGNVRAKPG